MSRKTSSTPTPTPAPTSLSLPYIHSPSNKRLQSLYSIQLSLSMTKCKVYLSFFPLNPPPPPPQFFRNLKAEHLQSFPTQHVRMTCLHSNTLPSLTGKLIDEILSPLIKANRFSSRCPMHTRSPYGVYCS